MPSPSASASTSHARQRPHRTRVAVRARLVGLVASVVLLVLLVGIPLALAAVAGNPLPASAPSPTRVWGALTQPDDGSLFLQALVCLGWVAWAAFAVPLILEIAGALGGWSVPRVPALGLQQRAATGLVGSAALLFAAVPLASAAAPASPPAPVAAVATVASTTRAPQQALSPPAAPAPTRTGTGGGQGPSQRTYQVRHGDSLWSIAAAQLGDGARFKEITALNYGRGQPDGRALGPDHWIRPGWTLLLPGPAPSPAGDPAVGSAGGPGGEVVHPAGTTYQVRAGDSLWSIAATQLGDGERFPEIAQASAGTTQAGGQHLVDPDLLQPGWELTIPGQQSPGTAAAPQTAAPQAGAPGVASQAAPAPTAPTATPPAQPRPVAPPAAASTPATSAPGRTGDQEPVHPSASPGRARTGQFPGAAPGQHEDQRAGEAGEDGLGPEWGVGVRTGAGVGAVLAAGVLGLLGARRSAQQRRRRAGSALPMPGGEAADVEQELRAAADPLTARTVDLALRTLAARCGQDQQPLPVVRAARLTAEQFDLYLAEPAHLPAPWQGTVDAAVWTLPAGAHGLLNPGQAREVPAPYPSLVTIGHDSEDGHVLLDLEHLGALGVTGEARAVQEVLAAITIELATSSWADDLQVTVVGAYPELEDTLRSGRIRYLPALGRLLEELGQRAANDRDVLRAGGAADLNHARAARTAPDAWTPEIVLLAGQVTDHQHAQLEGLLQQVPRVAIAAVTAGRPLGEWVLHLDDDQPHHAVLDPIGLALRPQRIDERTYAYLLDVLAIADDDPTAVAYDAAAADQDDDAAGAGATSYSIRVVPAGAVHASDLPDPDHAVPPPAVADHTSHQAGPYPGVDPAPDPTTDLSDAHTTGHTPRTGAHAATSTASPALEDVVRAPAAGATSLADHDALAAEQGRDIDPADADGDDAGGGVGGRQVTGDGVHGAAPGRAVRTAAPGDHLPPGGDEGRGVTGNEAVAQAPQQLAPRILLLGAVEVHGATGAVEPSKRNRLTELAAFLATNPGLAHAAIDAALWPGTPISVNARNTAMSKLRRWLGKDTDLGDYLPKYTAQGGYRLAPQVRTDWQEWCDLLPTGPTRASTGALERALALVRGRPFDAVNAHRYAWAEPLRQSMISAVVDAADELARRQLMEGRWRAAEQTVVLGLSVEPGMERLWRTRILTARASGNPAAEAEAIDRMTVIADELGGDLEEETLQLLADLGTTDVGSRRQLTTGAR